MTLPTPLKTTPPERFSSAKWILLTVIAACVLAGCQKPKSTQLTPIAPLPTVAEHSAQPPPTPDSTPAPEAEAVIATDLLPTAPPGSYKTKPVNQELTMALQIYNNSHGSLPKDINALVAGKYIKAAPVPPPGKKFALDRESLQMVILDQ